MTMHPVLRTASIESPHWGLHGNQAHAERRYHLRHRRKPRPPLRCKGPVQMRSLYSRRDGDCGDTLGPDCFAERQANLTTIGGLKRLIQEFFKLSRSGVLRAMRRLGHLGAIRVCTHRAQSETAIQRPKNLWPGMARGFGGISEDAGALLHERPPTNLAATPRYNT